MSFSLRNLFRRDAPKPPASTDARRAAQDLVDRGIAAESSGDPGVALRCYREAVAADPQFAAAHMNLGIALQAGDDLAGALASHRQAVTLDPDHAAAHYNLGMALLAGGEQAAAEKHFRAALGLRAEFPEAWVGLAEALEAIGRDAEALGALDAAIAQRPHYVGAIFNASALLRKMGRPGDAEARLRMIDLRALFSNGRYAEVEAIARQMLQTWPEQGFGWKALGAAHATRRQFAEAQPALREAVRLQPADAETHNLLGYVLLGLGDTAAAEASIGRALEIDPDLAEAHDNLGSTLWALDQPDRAEASYRRALELKPDFHEAYNNLGTALRELGRLAEAETQYRRALELRPDFEQAHNNLGVTLTQQGRPAEGEASCRRALALNSDLPAVHCNLGLALAASGRLDEALASYRRALELKPDFHEARSYQGNALWGLGRYAEAQASCREAVELSPDYAEGYVNLGITLQAVHRYAEAAASFRRAIELKPEQPDGHGNLANSLQSLGRFDEAVPSYRRALELKADYHEAHSNLIFTLDLMESCSVLEHQAERRRWYEQHARMHAAAIRPHANQLDPERRLRIGYVSADFRRHSAYYAFSPVILRHDRDAFEVLCYSGTVREDDATARLRQAVDGWRSTLGMSDEALAEQIRDDRIDILVDLSGHSAANRLRVFARKPAPVQITAWGHATGTGLETMDYFLADPVLIPVQERAHYAEEVLDLPCCLCYEPPEYLPEVSPLPALAGRPFTFGCINRVEKITDRVMGLWGRILAALPGAAMLIKGPGLEYPQQRQRLVARLRSAGVEGGRVRLLGTSPHAEHLKAYGEVDLGLDPYPHGGGISTAEALCMGVPVVSLSGPTVASRVSASILAALEMREWIAKSDADYVRIAIEAAGDLPRLARTRAGLRARLAASAFGDAERYTRAVEDLYRSAWRRWCERHAA